MSDPLPDDRTDLLLELGALIELPDTDAEEAARVTLGGDRVTDYGRLGELALWWAAIHSSRPTTQAQPAGRPAPGPGRVLLAGGGVDVAARRPGVRALALPRGGTVDAAIAWGAEVADRAADERTDLVLLCLDDAEPWRVLAADLLGMDVVEASGWPEDRGLSDEQWMDEVTALRCRLRGLRGLRSEPTRLLSALGSPAIAAAATLLVAATARRTPVLLDGPGAAAVALLGVRASFAAPRWWQAAHQGEDGLHERVLGSLGLEPLTRLGVRVTDGTAALAALALLDVAAGLLDDGPTGESDAPDDVLAG